MIDVLRSMFREGVELHPVGPSLWSTLSAGGRDSRYDRIVASYDRMIGSALYQRLAWGNDPRNDVAFARAAVAASKGPLVDVGCGSLLFTAQAHLDGGRPTLLLDLSLGMLRRASERLREASGGVFPQIELVQADALDLSLRPGCAATVLCPGILHLFEDPSRLLAELAALLAPGGSLHLTSLVTDRRFGRGYLRLLERSGEVGSLISSKALRQLVEQTTGLETHCETVGNLAYLHTERKPDARETPRQGKPEAPGTPAAGKPDAAPGLAAVGPNAAMIDYWNQVAAPGWVAGQEAIDAHLAPFAALLLERADPQPGERAVDVGCGCGATTLLLAERVGPQGRVTAVDVSTPMLARAAERVRAAGLSQVEFVNADAQDLAFEPVHDLVTSRFGVMFFRDFERAFANLRSALVPGGRISFVCWRTIDRNSWIGVPMQAAARHIEIPLPTQPGEPGPYGLADGERLAAWLRGAGFESPELESLDLELPVRGGVGLEAAADFATSMGPVAAALRQADAAMREPVRAAVRDALAPYERDGVVLLGASIWRVWARNPG